MVWDYSDADELIEAVSAQGTILYDYDAAGRRTQMIAASQAAVNYSYDDGDRLQAIQQGSETVEFDYDDIDRFTQQTLPNGVKSGYAYNDAGQVTGIAWLKADDTPLGDLGYGYDALGRLVAQTGSFASNSLPAASSGTNVFDDNNRQTQYNGQALTYDATGNLTGDGTNTYVWNTRNQLVQVKQGATVIASYSYDPLGRRTVQDAGGAATTYLYDGMDAIQETRQGFPANPILTGLGIDQRFARNDYGGRNYFLTDHLGSTRALTDASGNIANRYDYTPYGQTTESSPGYMNPYQYTGREKDASTGLYHYRARYYHPGMGRFISEDSYGFAAGDNNFYAYALGNPVSYNDPSGHIVWFALVPIIWGGIEIAMSIYDLYDTGKTLMDPCVSRGRKAAAVLAMAAGVVLPGSFGWADDAAEQVIKRGNGLDVNDIPQRFEGPWTQRDLARAAEGKGPLDMVPTRNAAGREVPLELHHAGQVPGSAIHEVAPFHSNIPGAHPNKYNQGVTPQMRSEDASLHWQMRGQEMGNRPPGG